MIKAVIFDLNGILIQGEWLSNRLRDDYNVNEEAALTAVKDVLPKLRLPNAPDAYSLWKPYLDKWKIDLNKDQFLNYWFSGEHPIEEMVQVASSLKEKGIKTFILSNNFEERTTYYKANFPFINEFDRVYFSHETGFVKPDKRGYEKLLKDNQLQPEECLYIDDSDDNIRVALELGINSHKFEGIEDAKRFLER